MDFGGVGADEEVEIIEGFQPKKTPPTHHPDVGSDSDVTSAAGAPIGAAVPPVSAASGSMALLEDRLRQSLEDPTAATNTNTNRNKNTNNALQQLQQLGGTHNTDTDIAHTHTRLTLRIGCTHMR